MGRILRSPPLDERLVPRDTREPAPVTRLSELHPVDAFAFLVALAIELTGIVAAPVGLLIGWRGLAGFGLGALFLGYLCMGSARR
jgi:hypothetical protein